MAQNSMLASKPCRALFTFFKSFGALKHAPRELWLLFICKIAESYAYFAMSLNFALFLSAKSPDGFGLSDTSAGVLYGVWGVLISAYGLITGPFVIDKLGCRKSIIIAGVLGGTGRILFAVSTAPWLMYVTVLLLTPVAMSMAIPVMTIGVKRYTNRSTRTVAFSLYYTVMNVGALAAGWITDVVRSATPDEGTDALGAHLSYLRIVFIITGVVSLAYGILAFFMREVDVGEDGRANQIDTDSSRSSSQTCSFVWQTLRNKDFWRLTLFMLLLTCVRLIFRHLDATFPKYLLREFPKGTPYGTIYSINPATIIVLVPIVASITKHYDAYKCIVVGSYVAALSVFLLTFGNSVVLAIGFVVTLSIGEAIYSPRVYEYTMLVSPNQAEGLYTTLASAPMFVAKLFAGSLSGILLDKYCPAEGERDCQIMWLIIALISLSSPLLMSACARVIHTDAVKRRIADADRAQSGGADIEFKRLDNEEDGVFGRGASERMLLGDMDEADVWDAQWDELDDDNENKR